MSNAGGGNGPVTVQQIWDWLDSFAPFATQEAFDNAGLVIGDPSATVECVLFALDATLPVVREAQTLGVQLMVTHHPLLFGGIRQLRTDRPEGAAVAAIAGSGLNLIAAHTNFDQAPGGTGDSLASALGLAAILPTPGTPYLRTGFLPAPMRAADFLADVDRRLGACARLYGDPQMTLHRVAVGPGACGDAVALAAADGAQAYVVGEIKHHELLEAQGLGLTVLEAGHGCTEQPGITALYQRFLSDAQAGHWPVQAHLTAIRPCGCTTA